MTEKNAFPKYMNKFISWFQPNIKILTVFKIFLILLLFLTIDCVQLKAQQTHKQTPIRIQFKPGKSSASINGKLTSSNLHKNYLIGAKANQELFIQIKADSSDGFNFVNFIVYDPSNKPIGSDKENDSTTIRLSKSGDYRIELSPPGSFYKNSDQSLTFEMLVKIQ